MVEAVAAANGAVGLDAHGSLTDQVGRILRETGIVATRGSAPAPKGGVASGSSSPVAAKASAGTATATNGDAESRPGSSQGVMTTQTAPPKTFYERFLEQKKKDGL